MSNDALQRTVRRTGAVVVFAIGALTMAFVEWTNYQGIPLDIPSGVVSLLFFGPLVYLAGSFVVGVAAVFDPGARDASEDGEQAADSAE